jgi:MoxR-like ATPase
LRERIHDRDLQSRLEALQLNVERVVRGKPEAIRLLVTALLARGHVLIEDVPGVGKTTLARTLARSIGGTFHRLQFTSDLLPSDILGVSIYNQEAGHFDLKPGPIFAHIVLADELNRTPPRTQSALLEAMNEGQVSIDDRTYPLGPPFMVVATQNPQEYYGTFPLPESQLDRFIMRLRLGYPDERVERRLLAERGGSDPVARVQPVMSIQDVVAAQERVEAVRVDESLVDYVMRVVTETRRSPMLGLGVSTRGALAWYRLAQSYALLDGRDYVIPDDLRDLAVWVLAHRVVVGLPQEAPVRSRDEAERIIREILDRVPVPT